MRTALASTGLLLMLLAPVSAQQPANPTQQIVTTENVPVTGVPVYRTTVIGRTTKAVNYRHRGGATKVNFEGTPLLPKSKGEAKVESKQGYIEIEVEFDELEPASKFGPEFLTYVMWAVTPEGRAQNLGEVLLNGTESKLNVTTELQAFGLIITAEPYFAVTQPSDVVVMENIIRPDTRGNIEFLDAKYELLKRGYYTLNVQPSSYQKYTDSKIPLELYEARNAVMFARVAGADRYAGDTYRKAADLLQQAEDYQAKKAGKREVVMSARQSAQTAEDSRLVALQRIEQERVDAEKRASAQREADAKAAADREAQRRLTAESERLAAERARLNAEQETRRSDQERVRAQQETALAQGERQAAERAKAEAELAAQRSRDEKNQAEAARDAAKAEVEGARLEVQEATRLKSELEKERAELRARLQQQLNLILETRDSARGLIVNLSDVLFETAKHDLKPGAREKLAKISGIVLAHPGLQLEIEGHTDSVGSDEYNQALSDRRAESVRTYLLSQGIPTASITAKGFGELKPVASNDDAAGRQRNRRVEIVVSGDLIGTTSTTITVKPSGQ